MTDKAKIIQGLRDNLLVLNDKRDWVEYAADAKRCTQEAIDFIEAQEVRKLICPECARNHNDIKSVAPVTLTGWELNGLTSLVSNGPTSAREDFLLAIIKRFTGRYDLYIPGLDEHLQTR